MTKYDIQLTDAENHSFNLVLNTPREGLWKAPDASTITDTGGGTDHSKWGWDKKDEITLYELGYPDQPMGEPKVKMSGVARFPLKVDDHGVGKQLFGGVRIKKGGITWKCVNVM